MDEENELAEVVIQKDQLDDLEEADEILTRIELKEERCGKLALEVEDASEILKSKKSAYQAAVLELRELCRIRKEGHPLFDQPTPEVDAAAWRTHSLSHLGIEGKLQAKLEDFGLTTLGHLTAKMNEGIEWYKEIKGIGVKAAEEIADRFADFWALHPEFCEEPDDGAVRLHDA